MVITTDATFKLFHATILSQLERNWFSRLSREFIPLKGRIACVAFRLIAEILQRKCYDERWRGRSTEQFVGSNVQSITSIISPLPLSSSQHRDGESRADRSTTLPVMRRIYASGVRATDAYSFPFFLDVDPSWQPKWQPNPLSLVHDGVGLVRIHICTSRRATVNDTGRNFATMSTLSAPATFFPIEFP